MKRILRIILYVLVFHLVVFGLTMCSLNRYTTKAFKKAQQEKPYDVVIVPGVPYDSAEIGTVFKARIRWAKFLYDSGFTKNIIFSGSAVYSPYVEGIVMKTIADSLGIPSAHTFSETKAEHSTENIYYSWKMAKKLGFAKIALATDPFQSFLLRGFGRKYCPGIGQVPMVYVKFDISKPLPKVNPSSAYKAGFVSIKDREGLWKRLQGTWGGRVVKEFEKDHPGGITQ
jgi:uncharacterized SAM-binding protein YcdF (DUF218 family)